MSLKPPKASDMNKNWMTKRRNRAIKIKPEYHLIVTEGEKTEPLYFEQIKQIINNAYGNKIQIKVEGEGKNTLQLFEAAIRMAKNDPNGFSHVWIVFDTDDFRPEDINRTAELCEQKSSDNCQYHAIWSNQCIELWYLLHFGFYQSDIHRKEYYPKLSRHLTEDGHGEYAKNRSDMYEILRSKMDTAVKNARRLNELNSGKLPSNSAPGTKVYEIIEKLKAYL